MGLPGRRPQRAADRRHRLRQVHHRGCHHHAAAAGQPHLLQQGGRRGDPRAEPALVRPRVLQVRAERGRRLGIESEQAMELFHQTVSMKSVGNLNDFVRSHMLEPFDAASWTDRLVAHFEDLTRAHEAVRRAQDLLAELRKKETGLQLERAGHGGDRLSEIERRLAEDTKAAEERMRKAERFGELLAKAGMEPVETARQFSSRRREIVEAAAADSQHRADCQNRLTEVSVEAKVAQGRAAELNAELVSLRSRTSSIPKRSLDLRQLLCRELQLAEPELPFAGELIQVRPEESAWEGAAERLLHSFALSLLVPDEHYPAVSDWINDHHLGARLVYYRVPARAAVRGPARGSETGPRGGPDGRLLFAKLEIKDTEFYPWLERELSIRAGFDCVETMAEFRRAPKAITKAGQIKGSGGRHEKDDRTRIDDRSS